MISLKNMKQHTNLFRAIFNKCTKPDYKNFSLTSLMRAPLFLNNQLQQQCFRTAHFEKVLCRSAFRKQFGLKQCSAHVNTGLALTHTNTYTNTTDTDTNTNMSSDTNMSNDTNRSRGSVGSVFIVKQETYEKPTHFHYEYVLGPNKDSLHQGTKASKIQEQEQKRRIRRLSGFSKVKDSYTKSSIINVHWAAEQLVQSIVEKKNARAVIQDFIRDVQILFRLWGSVSSLKGVKVVVKGLLSRKRGMSQKTIFSVGAVPESTVKAHVDFHQRVIQTKLGSVGLKLWLCYA
jgi:hypothetical protein